MSELVQSWVEVFERQKSMGERAAVTPGIMQATIGCG